MKTRAAVARAPGKVLSLETVEIEGPKWGEVMVEVKATGICHTDEYTLSGADPEGLFPAIDPLQSSSKMATPGIVGERHYTLAQEIRRTLAQYGDLKDIIAMLGLEQLSPEDRKVVVRARLLERFLTQPFFTTEQFTNLKGKLVSLKDALDGCESILRDEFKDYPESALYMIGKVDEAKEKLKTAKPEADHATGSHAP